MKHWNPDKHKTIDKYRRKEVRFRRNYERKPIRIFNAFKDHVLIEKDALKFIENKKTELNLPAKKAKADLEFEATNYSSEDELLDKNIYELQPISYTADSANIKLIDVSEKEQLRFTNISAKQRKELKEAYRTKFKRGEIEEFVKVNYDPYYHNISLDKVQNFELYFPTNNFSNVIVTLEKTRLKTLVEMGLLSKPKYLGEVFIDTLKKARQPFQVKPQMSVFDNKIDIEKANYNDGLSKMASKMAFNNKIIGSADYMIDIPNYNANNYGKDKGSLNTGHSRKVSQQEHIDDRQIDDNQDEFIIDRSKKDEVSKDKLAMNLKGKSKENYGLNGRADSLTVDRNEHSEPLVDADEKNDESVGKFELLGDHDYSNHGKLTNRVDVESEPGIREKASQGIYEENGLTSDKGVEESSMNALFKMMLEERRKTTSNNVSKAEIANDVREIMKHYNLESIVHKLANNK